MRDSDFWDSFACPLNRRCFVTYTLLRVNKNNLCTFGVMKDENDQPFIVTLELPDKDNIQLISCIPEGLYTAIRYMSPKRGYEVFELQDIPNRDAIEVHIGNYPSNTDGCILVGLEFGDHSIGSSKLAFDKFMNKLGGVNMFTLKISTT
jgi:hypothetical protein